MFALALGNNQKCCKGRFIFPAEGEPLLRHPPQKKKKKSENDKSFTAKYLQEG